MARMINCIKLGTEAEGLDFPPYPGDLGKRIWEGGKSRPSASVPSLMQLIMRAM